MAVHTDDDLSGGLRQRPIEAGGDDAAGVVEEPDIPLGMPGDYIPDDLPRGVVGHPISNEDLHELRWVVLGHHGAEAPCDEIGLVADGEDDCNRGRLHTYQRIGLCTVASREEHNLIHYCENYEDREATTMPNPWLRNVFVQGGEAARADD